MLIILILTEMRLDTRLQYLLYILHFQLWPYILHQHNIVSKKNNFYIKLNAKLHIIPVVKETIILFQI
jgi:hypothetical protein